MNEIIKNAIDVYIQEEKSDYAVMLNGPWGCGKTYFVKNELIDYLQDKFNKNVVYISLFGINNLDDLYNNIALQILNIKTIEYLDESNRGNNSLLTEKSKKLIKSEANKHSWMVTVLNKGLKILPDYINSVISEIYKNKADFTKYIFVFDDVERCTIPYEVLLGFFDQVVDQNSAKAILVCNEKAINSKEYQKFKEKVIGLTIDYDNDINKSFDSIINSYLDNSDCKNYVVEEKENILELFRAGDTSNLRTLIFIIKRFKEMYNEILKISEPWDAEKQYLDKFIRETLLAIVGSSILIKEKHKNNDFKDMERIFSIVNETNEKEYNVVGMYPAYKFIDNYLGTFNTNEDELKNVIGEFIKREKADDSNIINTIDSIFDEDSDEIAITKLNKILDEIQYNRLNINIYSRILDKIFMLLNSLDRDTYESKIEEIKMCIRVNAKLQADNFSSFSWYDFPCYNEDAKVFKNELFELLKAEKEKSIGLEWKNIFENDENFVEKFEDYMKKNHGMFVDGRRTMSQIGADKVFERIKNLKIKEIKSFYASMSLVFDEHINNLKDFYSADKDFFKELKEKIEADLLKGNRKSAMQKMQLEILCNYLGIIYKKL